MEYKSLKRSSKGNVATAISDAYYPTEYFNSDEVGEREIGDNIILKIKARVTGINQTMNQSKKYTLDLRELAVDES